MREDPDIQELIAEHIRAARRPEHESVMLADRLLRSCWPAGVADRTEPVARGWLRMWGPVKIVAAVPGCTCDEGHCTICN